MSRFYTEGANRKANHYLVVLSRINDRYLRGGEEIDAALVAANDEWPFIEVGQSWAADRSAQDSEMARACIQYALIGRSIVALRLHPKRRIQWLTAASSVARRMGDQSSEAGALAELGRAHADLSEYDLAGKWLDSALQLARSCRDRKTEAISLENRAWVFHSTGNNRKAIDLCIEAIAIAEEIGDRTGMAKTFSCMGLAALDLSERANALAHFERALSIARDNKDRVLESSILNNIGLAHQDNRLAIEYYEQALRIARTHRNVANEANIVMNLGIARLDAGEASQALLVFEQAVLLMQQRGNRRNEGRGLGNIGRAYFDLKDYPAATRYFKAAREIAEAVGDRLHEATVTTNLGITHATLNETNEAIACYTRALTIQRDIGDREGTHRTLRKLGDAYEAIGRSSDAIREVYPEALAIAETLHDARRTAEALYDLGVAHKRLGEHEEAIAYFDREIDILRDLGDSSGEGWTLNTKGDCYTALGSVEPAKECYEAAYRYGLVSRNKRLAAKASNNLGGLHRDERRFDKAILAFELAIENDPSDAWTHRNVAVVHQIRLEHHIAIEYFKKAIELSPEVSFRSSLIGSLRQCGEEEAAMIEIGLVRDNLGEENTYSKACFAAVIGNHEDALNLLTQALGNNEVDVEWVSIDPDWQTLHQDGRFMSIIDKWRSRKRNPRPRG